MWKKCPPHGVCHPRVYDASMFPVFQSPGAASISYSARSTKLFSLILRTLTKSPHSWTWIRPLSPLSPRSPLSYSLSLSFSVTSVRLPQVCRYMYLTPTTSTMPKPAELPSSMPSSQALCLGIMSGYFPSLSGVPGELGGRFGLVSVLGSCVFNSWPRFSLKFGWRFGWGSGFGWTTVLCVAGVRSGWGSDGAKWFWISRLWPMVSFWEGTGEGEDMGGL